MKEGAWISQAKEKIGKIRQKEKLSRISDKVKLSKAGRKQSKLLREREGSQDRISKIKPGLLKKVGKMTK